MKTKTKYQINKKCVVNEIEKNYSKKQNIKYINYKELHRSYVELQNKLKAMEEKFTSNDSKNKTLLLKN